MAICVDMSVFKELGNGGEGYAIYYGVRIIEISSLRSVITTMHGTICTSVCFSLLSRFSLSFMWVCKRFLEFEFGIQLTIFGLKSIEN